MLPLLSIVLLAAPDAGSDDPAPTAPSTELPNVPAPEGSEPTEGGGSDSAPTDPTPGSPPAAPEAHATPKPEPEPVPAPPPRARPKGPDRPPVITDDIPPEAASDLAWVQLSSGEWLRAEVTALLHDELEVDSDKLDDLVLDWGDVVALWLPAGHVWAGPDRKTYTGPAVLYDGVVTIRTDAGLVRLPKDEVIGMTKGDGSEIEYWSFEGSLGLDLSFGNTRQGSVSGTTRILRRGPIVRISIGYTGSLGATQPDDQEAESNRIRDWERNVHRHLGDASVGVAITRIFYVAPAFADAYYDQFQNILIRLRAGAGFGTYWEISPKVTWETLAGGIYQFTKYTDDDYGDDFMGGGVRLQTAFEFEITGDLDLDLSWQSDLIVNDFGQSAHTGSAKLDYDLTDALSLFAQFTFSRIEDPPAGTDEVAPQSNDYHVVAGLSIDL